MSRIHRRGRGGINFGLILLAGQIFRIGTDNIPPVTLGTIIVNVLIYLRLIPNLPDTYGACTSNTFVIDDKQWKRLFYSSFYHLDDMHLYFNMISFLMKGIYLEKKLKSRNFFILIALFCFLTQAVMLGVNQFFAELFSNPHYLRTCAAGFSAVCFAVKVVTTTNSTGNERIMGLPFTLPSKYIVWFELVLIQILVPNASFTGHLAGILVGLAYTHGPLKKIVDFIDSIFSGISPTNYRSFSSTPSYNYQTGQTGRRSDRRSSTSSNEDEDLQHAIRESLRTNTYASSSQRSPPSYGWHPDVTSSAPYPNSDQTMPYPTGSAYSSEYERHSTDKKDSSYPTKNNQPTPEAPQQQQQQQSPRNIYPDLSQTEYSSPPYPVDNNDIRGRRSYKQKFTEPSAPYEDENIPPSSPPPPYTPTDESMVNSQAKGYSTIDHDSVRNARLRRFDKK